MCTVTFIPAKEKIFITSNRDEKQLRSPAIPPAVYEFSSGKILFPRDTDGGGTWFAVHENGNAVIFLNGGWEKHEPRHPYKKSRGLVLLELADSERPLNIFLRQDLENIEPFTAIIWQGGLLLECRWDANQKYTSQLDEHSAHIWSSVTLYDENTMALRKLWFTKWLQQNPLPTQDDILHFHEFTGDGDPQNDLLMNRNNIVFNVSITSVTIAQGNALMKYIDRREQQSYLQRISLLKPIPVR